MNSESEVSHPAGRTLPIGITFNGVVHTDHDNFDIATRFSMVREAGVFDYIERMPLITEINEFIRCSHQYGIPVRNCSWYYTVGRDEPLIEWHLNVCRELGAKYLNIQLGTYSTTGELVSDQRVAEVYLKAFEHGNNVGVQPAFEIHVNNWSEHFGRVAKVADLVEAQGVPFRITLDHSHVVFKIDNPKELKIQQLQKDVDDGTVVLEPGRQGNVCELWIERNLVVHAHARSAVPNNPVNSAFCDEDGRVGRGIQYPFTEPKPGQWHSEWNEQALEPWKYVVRALMHHHATNPQSPLGQISTEFLTLPDYAAGCNYSIFENSIACANWLRAAWLETLAKTASEVGTSQGKNA